MMTIPHFSELRKPILEKLSDGKVWKKSELTAPLAKHFSLSDEEITKEYESGNGIIFNDRISWTLSYLTLCELLDRPKRGYYVINSLGRQFLSKSNQEINEYIDKTMALRNKKIKSEPVLQITLSSKNSIEETPQELLYASYKTIRHEIYTEIIDTIISKTPKVFEKLVVDLLQKMGYGGAVENSGAVTQYSEDGGREVEITEDILGFGRIYIQAKRYKKDSTIGRPEIQRFVGSLMGRNADKGVFITTAQYSNDAIEYANTLPNAKVVLIDGMKLAEYVYQYDLGMQTEQTFSIKKLDTDFWDSLLNDDVQSSIT